MSLHKTFQSNLEATLTFTSSRILAAAKGELAAHNAEQAAATNNDTPSPRGDPAATNQRSDVAGVLGGIRFTESPAEPGQINSPMPGAVQVETPFAVQIALKTMKQLEEYDSHCAAAREPYERALARLRGELNGQGGPEQRGPKLQARRQSIGATGVSSGHVDHSRDPRRRG